MGKYFGTDGFRGEYGQGLCDFHAELIGEFLASHIITLREDSNAKNNEKSRKSTTDSTSGKSVEKSNTESNTESSEKGNTKRGESAAAGTDEKNAKSGAKILIGRDTRASSEPLAAALIRGIRNSGGAAISLGVCTTPATAYCAKISDADAAVMITASHNPWWDNGIKIFDCHGQKISDEVTKKIESFIDEGLKNEKIESFIKEGLRNEKIKSFIDKGTKKGRMDDDKTRKNKEPSWANPRSLLRAYEEHLCAFGADFSGMRIGLDCANGGAFAIAPRVFSRLGAEVLTIGTAPDGENINRGVGSTNIGALRDFVAKNKLDIGFAFDGDGDRCIAVSSRGEVIDGDGELLNLALNLQSQGGLKNKKIALTVMSNGSLLRALKSHGIDGEICPVGDRFVAEKMRELGLALGGEQSGHIILGGEVTGDGILTAVCLAKIARERGFLENFTPIPQVSENVSVRDKESVMRNEKLISFVEKWEKELSGEGRILLRPSGTENLIRIMVEHQNKEKCKLLVSKIADLVREIDGERIL